MLQAGIDIGTNTILLLIADVVDGKIKKVLEDHVRVVRLGQNLDKSGVFCPEALERARNCFSEYCAILKKYSDIKIIAVATAGARAAKNAKMFFEEVEKKFSIPIQIISGEQEAEISFRGAVGRDYDQELVSVIDIGGGSTEFVGQKAKKIFKHSFAFGCVRMTERFFSKDPPGKIEIEKLEDFITKEFQKEKEFFKQLFDKTMIAVAGTPTYLSSAMLGLKKFEAEKIHNSEITLAQLNEWIPKLGQLTSKQRLGLGGMDAGRADVILAGAIILRLGMQFSRQQKVIVSVRGLRYGLVTT